LRVVTKAFGAVEVDERQSITFPAGLYGFEQERSFVLLDGKQKPFYWLQSVQQASVAFVVLDPFSFRPDYEIDITDAERESIGLDSPQQALPFVIVTIHPSGLLTANLQGPVVVNRHNHLARQVILTDPRWKTRHDVLAELRAAKERNPC
jgi:flagellar assembly factor FliW